MPQDHPRTETGRTEQQRGGGGARSEQMRGETTATAEKFTAQIGDMSKRSINASLRMQTEMLDALQVISRDWMTCATSEAELAMKLPNRIASARSIPDAITAYHEWLSEWLTLCGEDGRRLMADSQKFMAAGARCFAGAVPGAPN
jgi:hypothetical protein